MPLRDFTLPHPSILALDFDGVMVDSVALKGSAFADAVADFPRALVEAFRAYHLANGGVDRRAKFRHFFSAIANVPFTERDIEERASRFAGLVKDAVVRAPEIRGASDFLRFTEGRFPLAAISATPETELREILAKRGWLGAFQTVVGSPTPKQEALRALSRVAKDDTGIFVGDSINDYDAAVAAGWRFVGLVSSATKNPFPGTVSIVRDMEELGDALGMAAPQVASGQQ